MMISEIMNKYAKKSAKIWEHDRSQTIGASEIGQCARKMFWLKNEKDPRLGAPRNEGYVDNWGPLFRGTVYENRFWYPAMKAHYKQSLRFAGPKQRTFVNEFISATPDGMVYQLDNKGSATCFMVECKTIDPRATLNEAKDANVYQTHIQMGLIREQTIFKPTHSILSYTDASFWNEVTEFRVEFDEDIFEYGKKRAADIMLARDASELKPEGRIAGGKECEHCPFSRACGYERAEYVPKYDGHVDPQFAAEIRDMARAVLLLEQEAEAIGLDVATAKEELKARLHEKGVRKVPGVVTWSAVKGRTGYDNKAIKAAAIEAGVDVEAFKTTGDPSDRLTISLSTDSETLQAAE